MIIKCFNCGKWYRELEKHLLECPYCSEVIELEFIIEKTMKEEVRKYDRKYHKMP